MNRRGIRLTPLRRHLAAVVTVALSGAFVAVMVLAGSLVLSAIQSQSAQRYAGADLVVTTTLEDEDWATDGPLAAPQVEGAEEIRPVPSLLVRLTSDAAPAEQLLLPVIATSADADTVDGALPTAADQIALDRPAAEALGVSVGDTVTLPASASFDGTAATFTVVGIVPAPDGAAFGSTPRVLVGGEASAALLGPDEGTLTQTWLANVPAGTDPATVADATTTADVMTVPEALDADTEDMIAGTLVLAAIFGVFVVIALFTSAVVIANTFAVTVAQRTRSLALLRTLGATRSQVRATVLREALVVGLIGAVAGVLLGHGAVQLGLAVAAGAGWLDGLVVVPVSPLSVLLPVVAGLTVVVLASLAPARAATRVAPLQALRPVPPAAGGRGPGLRTRLGVVAIVLGVLALGGGTALAVTLSPPAGIALALLGGVVSFTGVLLTLTSLTRPLSRAVGALLGRIGGLPARIADANVGRNPARSAATIGALLIGTTLMSMMAVGARTAESTLVSELDSRRPIDVVVSADAVPEDATTRIAAAPGVDTAEAAARGDVEVGATQPMTLYGVTPDALRAVSHRPGLADRLEDGEVLLGADRAEEFGVADGDSLTVTAPDGDRVELTFRVDANLQMSIVTPSTLEDAVGDAATPVVLADFADPGTPEREGVDAFAVTAGVQEAAAGPGFEAANVVAGGAERELYGQILAVLLGITLGLLAVAVVVALVGVANTLSLGVVERRGENALLRALGTTRRQMRAMLGWEGVLLAVVGAVLGIALGTLYGLLGITAVLGATYPITYAVPWLQIGAVAVLAVLAGAAASVLPGRAAARTAPAEALAGGQ